jgi:hypothetical protein
MTTEELQRATMRLQRWTVFFLILAAIGQILVLAVRAYTHWITP